VQKYDFFFYHNKKINILTNFTPQLTEKRFEMISFAVFSSVILKQQNKCSCQKA